MDYTPPIGNEVLPPLSQASAAMEVEVQPPPSQPPSGSPMEWASPSSRVGCRLSCRRVGETAPASDMDCDEPPVVRDSTITQRDFLTYLVLFLLQTAQPISVATLPAGTAGPNTAQPHTSSMLPLELSGVPSTRIEECGHTHLDPAQTTAALGMLYDQQPLMLLSGDTFADREARQN
ncbi:g7992 [Coccomyxa elongata]